MRVVVVAAVTAAIVVAVAVAPACECGAPPGEGEAGEGEGFEDPDPNAIGIETRPSNTTCNAPARPVLNSDVDTALPWPDIQLLHPVFMVQEPQGTRMFAVQRGGLIVTWEKDDAAVTLPDVFGDLFDIVETSDAGNSEQGLLGFAFHPDWPARQEVFVAFTGFAQNGESIDGVSRFVVGAAGTIDAGDEERLIEISDPFANHNGGMIAFNAQDPCRTCLYYGDGDGGAGDDPFGNGQNKQTFLSKIVRIDVDGRDDGKNYAVPADNPFVDDADFLPEIWAYGLRNPWRWSFDRATGDLWAGDVGQDRIEEIDLVEAGGNYGWDVLEADFCHDESTGSCTQGGFTAPITQYQHGTGRVSITGGYMYRGAAMPDLDGTYFYADFGTGEVFALRFDDQGNAAPEVVLDLTTNIASFAEDNDGELYLIDHVTGGIRQIVAAAGAPPPDTFPRTLSSTGCVDPSDATKPAAGLIPYGVNAPLYSDGADKERFVALPDGTQAHVLDDGDIDFPVGTVFVKTFLVGGKRIETRLLVHHDDGAGGDGDWGGYSYEWNDAETDAALVDPAGKTKALSSGQQWTFPSRNGCLSCHALAAHRQLGWEIGQLNGGFVYPSGTFANQLHTLDHIGVFDAPLPATDLTTLTQFHAVNDERVGVEERARAYVHVNCSICHRPGGIGVADTDWRFDTSFADMKACNVDPTEGDLGVDGAKRLVPGDPTKSLVSLRMKRLGAVRMPLLGSNVVDGDGTALVDAWISSLTSCP